MQRGNYKPIALSSNKKGAFKSKVYSTSDNVRGKNHTKNTNITQGDAKRKI
jgi:hypothetical protein